MDTAVQVLNDRDDKRELNKIEKARKRLVELNKILSEENESADSLKQILDAYNDYVIARAEGTKTIKKKRRFLIRRNPEAAS